MKRHYHHACSLTYSIATTGLSPEQTVRLDQGLAALCSGHLSDLTAVAWTQEPLPCPQKPQEGRQGIRSSVNCLPLRKVHGPKWPLEAQPSHPVITAVRQDKQWSRRCLSWWICPWSHLLEVPASRLLSSLVRPHPGATPPLKWNWSRAVRCTRPLCGK